MIVFVSSSEQDWELLREVADRIGSGTARSRDIDHARDHIEKTGAELVIVDVTTDRESNWRTLLSDIQQRPFALIVASRKADEELWAEVLNLGGFDVLSLPFERDELEFSVLAALNRLRGGNW